MGIGLGDDGEGRPSWEGGESGVLTPASDTSYDDEDGGGGSGDVIDLRLGILADDEAERRAAEARGRCWA